MTEPIALEASTSTPAVSFDPDTGLLLIEGESFPENAVAFYNPILETIQAYTNAGASNLTLRIALNYLNTSSIKALMDLIDIAEEARQSGCDARVEWYYDEDDDRSLELAEEFREDISLPFTVVAYASET